MLDSIKPMLTTSFSDARSTGKLFIDSTVGQGNNLYRYLAGPNKVENKVEVQPLAIKRVAAALVATIATVAFTLTGIGLLILMGITLKDQKAARDEIVKAQLREANRCKIARSFGIGFVGAAATVAILGLATLAQLESKAQAFRIWYEDKWTANCKSNYLTCYDLVPPLLPIERLEDPCFTMYQCCMTSIGIQQFESREMLFLS